MWRNRCQSSALRDCRGLATGAGPGGTRTQAAALRSTEFLALVIEGAVQPFAKTIIAFILLRREKTEKRGLTWNGLLLKCD
jgi:hypothetical protein